MADYPCDVCAANLADMSVTRFTDQETLFMCTRCYATTGAVLLVQSDPDAFTALLPESEQPVRKTRSRKAKDPDEPEFDPSKSLVDIVESGPRPDDDVPDPTPTLSGE